MDTEAVLAFLRDNDGEWTWWEAVHLVSLLCNKPEVAAEYVLGGLLHDGRITLRRGRVTVRQGQANGPPA